MSKVGLIRGDGKGVFSEGLLKLFDGEVVRCHCCSGHAWHLVGIDSKLAGDSVKLMDGDAHDVGVGSGVYGKGWVI